MNIAGIHPRKQAYLDSDGEHLQLNEGLGKWHKVDLAFVYDKSELFEGMVTL